MTVETLLIPASITSREVCGLPVQFRPRITGSVNSASLAIVRTEVFAASMRTRFVIKSSLKYRGARSSLLISLKTTCEVSPLLTTKVISLVVAVSGICSPANRLRGVNRHASSRPEGAK